MISNVAFFTGTVVFAPLFGALIAGFFGKRLGPVKTHRITILLMLFSCLSALNLFRAMMFLHHDPITYVLFKWGASGTFAFDIGFYVDQLAAMMMVIVTFVSMFVHIYSIGYMDGDPGYQRFFAYMSAFTFAMLCLVSAHDFLVLFFGWEGVGLVSYLLIGFWFHKESAVCGNLKAFLVNRVGDLGFLLGIALVLKFFGTLNFQTVFQNAPIIANASINICSGVHCSVITVICLLLFVGAAGKSAQVPLHVWLPESMEGPTPISALIHAATMVTAGIYMITRMSPLFVYSVPAHSVILVLGGITALFMGILGVFQYDIKRVVAYSTLSQLGYMMVGVGASAYAAGMFHLFTHAFFKALLFLAAGSVIIGMHHEQDMRKMGGLRRHMPITWICFLIGSLSLAAIPPFSGFFSKDAIIDAVSLATIPGAGFAYWCVLLGAFVTGLYTFRALFMTFHGEPRFGDAKVHESPWVVWLPLVVLAVPSVILGGLVIKPLLFDEPSAFGSAIVVAESHNVLALLAEEFQGVMHMALAAIFTAPFWLSLAGLATAWLFVLGKPGLSQQFKMRFKWFYILMEHKYGFDEFNQLVFVNGIRKLGRLFYVFGDLKLVDGWGVHGTGKVVLWCSSFIKRLQTGYLFHYTLAMVLGMMALFFIVWLGR